MSGDLELMHAFQAEFMGGSPQEACRQFLSNDFKLLEPPELPQGGVFIGWDAPLKVSKIYRAIWNVDVISSDSFSCVGAGLVMSRYVMKWTHIITGKSLIEPIVELNTIANGKIEQMEVFHFDAAGLLATMRT